MSVIASEAKQSQSFVKQIATSAFGGLAMTTPQIKSDRALARRVPSFYTDRALIESSQCIPQQSNS